MNCVRIKKAGKWHDKPYEPQFEVAQDDEIPVREGTTVTDGKADSLSFGIADIMVDAGAGEYIERKDNPATADKKAAERNKAADDKTAAKKSKPR